MKQIIIFLVVLIISLVIVSLVDYSIDLSDVINNDLYGKELPSYHEKMLDILIDYTKLFISFSLGIICAVSYFFKDMYDKGIRYNTIKMFFLLLTGIMNIISIYFGHHVLLLLCQMLYQHILDLGMLSFRVSMALQYGLVLGSLVSFGFFLFVKKNEPGNN